MRICFVIPPPKRRLGGLDTALNGLRGALESIGVSVVCNFDLTNATEPPPAILHLHGLWQPGYSAYERFARQWEIPIVISPHGMLEPWAFRQKRWKKLPFFHLIEKPRLLRATSVLATSEMEAKNLRALLPKARMAVLPLGIPSLPPGSRAKARTALKVTDREVVWLYLSRLDKKKGLHLLLEAMTKLLPSARPDRLWIVGEGDPAYEQQLRSFVQNHAADLPTVEFRGAVWGAEKYLYFRAADLFCLPTHSENFGLAVLEALFCGTPVLTTSETPWGSYEALPGFWICQPNVPSIAAQLTWWASRGHAWTEEDRTKLAAWAAGRFHWDKLALAYKDFYIKMSNSWTKD